MKIDGRTISDDGQIELRGHELIQHRPGGPGVEVGEAFGV